MNRIERMLWEESNMNEIARLKPESRTGRFFKTVVLIAFLVGVITLLAARPWPPSMHEARAQGPLAAHVYEADAAPDVDSPKRVDDLGRLAQLVAPQGVVAIKRSARRADVAERAY
jgi:hypothetical protein